MNALDAPRPTHEKADVDYGRGMRKEHCGICVHFRQPGLCTLVIGRIRSQDWCKLFKKKG